MSSEGKTRVLVVDDEVDLANILGEEIQEAGFEVDVATGGRAALELYKKHRHSLVITDLNMPAGSGKDLLIAVKAISPRTPVILFMTEFGALTIDEAYELGAEAIFPKPTPMAELIATANEVLGERREASWTRRYPRAACGFKVSLKQSSLNGSGRAINVGRGGCFIRWEGALPRVGAEIDFEVDLAEGPLRKLSGHGVVRWVREATRDADNPVGFGVEFMGLAPQSARYIAELTNELKTRQYIPKS